MQVKPSICLPGILLYIFVTGCANNNVPSTNGSGTDTAKLAPVETKKANTGYKPAFNGQTRIAGVKTVTPYNVEKIADQLGKPWAVIPLPDGRLLITENDAVAAAEKLLAEAPAKIKDTEAKKVTAVNVAKEANTKATPRDVTATFYSQPIIVKVAAAPITLTATAASQVEQGAKVEISATVTRLYGFAEAVEVTLVLPAGVAGLSAAKITIPKDQTQGKVIIEAVASATPGDHALTLQAALKLNGQDIKVDQPVKLKVSAKAK